MTRATPALQIDNVTVHRGGREVLKDVTLRIDGAGLIGVVGPNGGGKSTLLSVITGRLPVSRGAVQVLGQSPARAAPRLGFVPQAAGFDRGFPISLRGMVATACLVPGLGLWRQPDRGQEARVDAALARMGLSDLAGRPLSALSGGELQRGLIARALATEPDMLLLDEPTASVDLDHAERLFELLCGLGQRVPVIVVSHDLAQIAAHSDRVFCVLGSVWEAARHASAADLAEQIFKRPAHCARREVGL
ncbi:metal ABC transporter ATP-binding protein [Rhodovulum sp.]|uniref:metal ABC transporter ATP-binding protein n=1 Tax=Rhodovulum sp. TaxID=34009 RepID=UPI0017DF9DA0|nr:ABC transporter ATP-binding protein [Rhodovulum sp.]HDR28941.1 ABC transporter ATP-binding protein [Rhodovulum sp.]